MRIALFNIPRNGLAYLPLEESVLRKLKLARDAVVALTELLGQDCLEVQFALPACLDRHSSATDQSIPAFQQRDGDHSFVMASERLAAGFAEVDTRLPPPFMVANHFGLYAYACDPDQVLSSSKAIAWDVLLGGDAAEADPTPPATILTWDEMVGLLDQHEFVDEDGVARHGLVEEPWGDEAPELQMIVPDADGDPSDICLYPQSTGSSLVIRRVGDQLSFDYGNGDCDTYTIILKEWVAPPVAPPTDFSTSILILEEHAARYEQIAQHVPLGGAAMVCNACAMAVHVLNGSDREGRAWYAEVSDFVRAAVVYGVLGVANLDPVEYAEAIALLGLLEALKPNNQPVTEEEP